MEKNGVKVEGSGDNNGVKSFGWRELGPSHCETSRRGRAASGASRAVLGAMRFRTPTTRVSFRQSVTREALTVPRITAPTAATCSDTCCRCERIRHTQSVAMHVRTDRNAHIAGAKLARHFQPQDVRCEARQTTAMTSSASSIIFSTTFIIFNTECIIFNAKFIILNTESGRRRVGLPGLASHLDQAMISEKGEIENHHWKYENAQPVCLNGLKPSGSSSSYLRKSEKETPLSSSTSRARRKYM